MGMSYVGRKERGNVHTGNCPGEDVRGGKRPAPGAPLWVRVGSGDVTSKYLGRWVVVHPSSG